MVKNSNPHFKAHKGFSLIELMIAIPISLLVLFAVLKIFTANIHGVSMQNGFSRVQENGRMAIELISRDIRGADYWGCANDSSEITNNLSDTSSVDLDLSDGGIEGSNDVSSLTIDSQNVLDGTDTLTLRGAQSYSNVAVESSMSTTSDSITVTSGNSIESGDMILITDCEVGDIFSNTSNTASNATLSSTSSLSTTYDTGAQILSPSSKTYFIAASASDASVYSLYRSVNGSASEMVRGINDLQISYGEDTNSSGSVDKYYDADSVDDMDDVLTIRIELMSESGNGVSGSSLERTYTVTTNIRNHTL
jgi:type IV pilus assembly protein PilW